MNTVQYMSPYMTYLPEFDSKKHDEAVLKFPMHNLPISDTAIEFNNVKAWKMTSVGNKPKFPSR